MLSTIDVFITAKIKQTIDCMSMFIDWAVSLWVSRSLIVRVYDGCVALISFVQSILRIIRSHLARRRREKRKQIILNTREPKMLYKNENRRSSIKLKRFSSLGGPRSWGSYYAQPARAHLYKMYHDDACDGSTHPRIGWCFEKSFFPSFSLLSSLLSFAIRLMY